MLPQQLQTLQTAIPIAENPFRLGYIGAMAKTAALCFALLPILLSSPGSAQGPAPTGVLKTSVDLVEVPVIVQRSGKHVAGLQKDNFVVQQDGKPQPIVAFEEVHSGRGATPTGATEENGDRQVPSQVTIVALDLVNTPNLDRAYFEKEFIKYLSAAGSMSGPMGLVAVERSGIRLLRGLSTDPRGLVAAVQRQGTTPPSKNNDSSALIQQLSRESLSRDVDTTVATGALRAADENMVRFQNRAAKTDSLLAIQQLAQALKGIPGRKTLILVGSGFNVLETVVKRSQTGFGLDYSLHTPGQALDQAAYTWKVLNDANVAVYPIDTRRTVNTAYQAIDTANPDAPAAATSEQIRQSDLDIINGFKTIAAQTGGRPCFYRTDLGNCVREAVDDDHDYYLLGFNADKSSVQPGWHRITVVSTENATLRYRQGFIIAEFTAEQVRMTDVQLALNSALPYTGLSFTGEFTAFSDRNGKKSGAFSLAIPPGVLSVDEFSGHVDFDVVAIARAEGGKEVARIAQRIDRKFPPENVAEIRRVGINYSNKLELAPGEYGIWFVMRDNQNGRTGSIVVALKVPQ